MLASMNVPTGGWRIAWVLTLHLGAGACTAPVRAVAPVPGAVRQTQERAVLLELFTSQGCSSCPPADELLADLPRMGLGLEKVVPLAYHVDYWDDLGWKDPYASPQHGERQRRYNRSGKLRLPDGQQAIGGAYTPQMVIGGVVHFPGGRRELALAEIRRAAVSTPSIDVALAARAVRAPGDSDEAVVSVRAHLQGSLIRAGEWQLHLALTARNGDTRVLAGENHGRQLREAAIVRALAAPVPLASALDDTARISVRKPADLTWNQVALAVFVQSAVSFEVAAALALPSIWLRAR
jgi:hypothetical protein